MDEKLQRISERIGTWLNLKQRVRTACLQKYACLFLAAFEDISEERDKRGIELVASAALQFRQRLPVGTSCLIGLVADHGMVGFRQSNVEAMEKASQINRMLGQLRQDVEKLNQRYGAS